MVPVFGTDFWYMCMCHWYNYIKKAAYSEIKLRLNKLPPGEIKKLYNAHTHTQVINTKLKLTMYVQMQS